MPGGAARVRQGRRGISLDSATICHACLMLALCSVYARCQYCDSLSTKRALHVLQQVQTGFHVPQCGNASLGDCDAQHCPIARRLSEFACWLIGVGKDYDFVREKLISRYMSLTSDEKYHINPSLFQPAGDSVAPVTIVVYISIGCPWCKYVCNFLHDTVTTGSLKGKAKVCVKLLSAGSRDMALLAAEERGRFWEYMRKLEPIERRLDEKLLIDIAKDMGIPVRHFKSAMRDEKLRERAMKSREEALAHDVRSTPTLFINGRRYHSYKKPFWIVDAVEYEYEQMGCRKQ